MTSNAKKKVVVVGGGVSGMVAAMALTQPELASRFDVTVYQMGWRLGGKGASGRNAGQNQRIEEHGLHIWFGFYDNAFTWMGRCYEELNRPAGAPLRTLADAFKPEDNFIFTELIDGKWREWLLSIPPNDAQPGGHPSIWDSIQIVLRWLEQQLQHVLIQGTQVVEADLAAVASRGPLTLIERWKLRFGIVRSLFLHEFVAGLRDEHATVDTTTPDASVDPIVDGLGHVAEILWAAIGEKVRAGDDEARRLWVLAYLAIVSIRGILGDKLWWFGYDRANGETFHAWLNRHAVFQAGAPGDPNGTAFWSAPVRAFFDAAFAYANGDTSTPNMAAGIAIRGIQRIALGYKGSVVYEMQAGMGDTVFTPFYEVLKRRGVNFEFFSRAGELELAADGKSVASLAIHRQVKLRNGSYRPLVSVKDLPCWPSEPLYDQIVDGDKLKASGADLSHYTNGWPDAGEPTVLRAGTDFDHIVLAAALPSLPLICPTAIAALPAWQKMVDKVSWTRTQAFQLWMTKTKNEIGLAGPPAVVGSYVEPWSSITDFTHLLQREDWPASYLFVRRDAGDRSSGPEAGGRTGVRSHEGLPREQRPADLAGHDEGRRVRLECPGRAARHGRAAAAGEPILAGQCRHHGTLCPVDSGRDRPSHRRRQHGTRQSGVRGRLDGQRLQHRQRRRSGDVGPAGGAGGVRSADRYRQCRRRLIMRPAPRAPAPPWPAHRPKRRRLRRSPDGRDGPSLRSAERGGTPPKPHPSAGRGAWLRSALAVRAAAPCRGSRPTPSASRA